MKSLSLVLLINSFTQRFLMITWVMFFAVGAQAESVDLSVLSECDDFYCPRGTGTPGSSVSDMKDSIEVDTNVDPVRGIRILPRLISSGNGGDEGEDVDGGDDELIVRPDPPRQPLRPRRSWSGC